MSSSAPRMLSTLSKALRTRWIVATASWLPSLFSSAARNSLAALSGCSRSWLAAATKRDFDRLARSAVASASSSASVRSCTRCSRLSLTACSAAAASRSAVTSVKLITKPRSGISWPKM